MKKIKYICVFILFCFIDLLLYFLGGYAPGASAGNALFLTAIFLEIAIYGTMILFEILDLKEEKELK